MRQISKTNKLSNLLLEWSFYRHRNILSYSNASWLIRSATEWNIMWCCIWLGIRSYLLTYIFNHRLQKLSLTALSLVCYCAPLGQMPHIICVPFCVCLNQMIAFFLVRFDLHHAKLWPTLQPWVYLPLFEKMYVLDLFCLPFRFFRCDELKWYGLWHNHRNSMKRMLISLKYALIIQK